MAAEGVSASACVISNYIIGATTIAPIPNVLAPSAGRRVCLCLRRIRHGGCHVQHALFAMVRSAEHLVEWRVCLRSRHLCSSILHGLLAARRVCLCSSFNSTLVVLFWVRPGCSWQDGVSAAACAALVLQSALAARRVCHCLLFQSVLYCTSHSLYLAWPKRISAAWRVCLCLRRLLL